METFTEKVRQVVAKIPEGETLTYKEVSIRAGNPFAYRAVGSIMSKNYDPNIPCHRVVRSNGQVGEYNRGGSQRKRELLAQEAKRKRKQSFTQPK
jgi:methylated-DNA-[protein]-cysteine S-methyltransferase